MQSLLSSPYRLAAAFLALSAALHVIAPIFSGFSQTSLGLAVIGLVYGGLSYLLQQERRWLAYVMFIVLILGALTAYISTGPGAEVANWVSFAIIFTNLGAILVLFGILWRNAPAQSA